MKKLIFLISLIGLSELIFSQVPKKVIVEHFTNTKCSVCASRNPGFYTNYNSQSGVIHLAIHPSSPYSACVLSMHNAAENDLRTNYYGVYGGTPRLVIQGVILINSTNYNSSSIFSPHLGQTSPASIKITESKFANDSIRSRITIKTEEVHSLPGLSLFVALAEDTVFYTGSNGEPQHYDVFRKSLTGAAGISVTLPPTVGDSVVFTMSSTVNGAWNFSRIFTLAILQETVSKAVVQAQSVSAGSKNTSTGFSTEILSDLDIRAYKTEDGIIVHQNKLIENASITVYDITGKILLYKELFTDFQRITLPDISTGFYLYSIQSIGSIIKTGKLVIQ